MLKNARWLSYSTQKYPFARILEKEVFKTRPLTKLHEKYALYKKRKGLAGLEYQDNLKLRSLMQNQASDSHLYKLYHAFIANVISKEFGGKISYSNRPQMRVHLAGTPSVSAWHRDVDVTDRPDQINVWLPFTDAYGTNTLWVESDYGLGDYQAVEVAYGQALLFDGGFLSHGTIANTSADTRISLDFRFAVLNPDFQSSVDQLLGDRPPGMKAVKHKKWKM